MGVKIVLGFVYLLLALYLVINAFGFMTMPSFLLSFDKWILSVAALILLFESFKYFKSKSLESP
ncbi:MAG: hypothetical protein KKF67_01955 [Nanoarchaeota archaeon]|nr:hypothetical protein [Nanoarchaeota archaeon]